jgi:ribosomal protein S27E
MTNIQAIDLLKGLEQSLDDYYGLNDEGKTAFHMAITALELFGNTEQLPSAQPKRKTGEWVDQDRGAFYTVECSECHKEPLLDAYGDYVHSNFCPFCGADMRGDNNG